MDSQQSSRSDRNGVRGIWQGGPTLRSLTPYFFLGPALLLLGLTVFYPAMQALYLSFTEYDLLSAPEWVGLKNFGFCSMMSCFGDRFRTRCCI
jgi:ABC-type sugar transport system permease subunit